MKMNLSIGTLLAVCLALPAVGVAQAGVTQPGGTKASKTKAPKNKSDKSDRAAKIDKAETRIDWTRPAVEIERFVVDQIRTIGRDPELIALRKSGAGVGPLLCVSMLVFCGYMMVSLRSELFS